VAHKTQQDYLQLLSEQLAPFFQSNRVLEIGSLDINGSVRTFFSGCEYTGLDVAEGEGVDVVCEGQKYDAPDASYDVVISCEVMEHNPYWSETFQNMIRLCHPGGLVIMTCATVGRPEHGTEKSRPGGSPLTVELGWNYYRNLKDKDFESVSDLASSFSFHKFWTDWNHFDLIFLGLRKGVQADPATEKLLTTTAQEVDKWLTKKNSHRVYSYRSFAARYLGDWWFKLMHKIIDSLVWLHHVRKL
jgi:SAM-dependent methyltransferase